MLTLSDISQRFGMRTVLSDISCELEPGTVTLLIGQNGAGKSTLLRIMAGLIRPSKGTVLRRCKDGEIGYLGHATFLYPGLSALENLAFWNQMQGRRPETEQLMTILKRVGLARYAEERAGVFSRGMAQRLNLARLLLQNPALWLLDEPGTGLDRSSLAMLHQEIAQARESGATVIWISHDIAADIHRADRVLALSKRTLEYDGPASSYAPEPSC